MTVSIYNKADKYVVCVGGINKFYYDTREEAQAMFDIYARKNVRNIELKTYYRVNPGAPNPRKVMRMRHRKAVSMAMAA